MKKLKLFLLSVANVLVLSAFSQHVEHTMVSGIDHCDATATLYANNVNPATIVWHGMGVMPKLTPQNGGYYRSNLCRGAYSVTYTTYDGVPMVVTFTIANSAGMHPCGGISVALMNFPTTLSDCTGEMTAVGASNQCGNFDGNPPFSYVWSNGSTSDHITNICPGKYIVVQTDSVGCAVANGYTIHEGPGYYNGIEELSSSEKTIVKITDITGRECAFEAGELRIVHYSDGSISKVISQ